MDEEGQRREAIAMLQRGTSITEICGTLGRTRRWLSKWRQRFAAEARRVFEGAPALRDRVRVRRPSGSCGGPRRT